MGKKQHAADDRVVGNSWALLHRSWRDWIRPHWRYLAGAGVLMLVIAGSTGLQPFIVERAVDQLARRDPTGLWLLPPAIMILAIIKGMAGFGSAVITQRLGLSVVANVQNAMFAHLMRCDLAFFHEQSSGKLVSRFLYDVNQMRSAMSRNLTGLTRELGTVAALTAAMFVLDWQLAAIVFFVFPACLVPIVKIGQYVKRMSLGTQEEQGSLSALLGEAFAGIRMVKAYRLEKYEEARAAATVARVQRLQKRAVRSRAIMHPVVEILGGLAVSAVLTYGAYTVFYSTGTIGSITGFLTAFLMAYQPMRNLSTLNSQLQEGLAAAERIFQLLDYVPRNLERPGARPLAVNGGEIRFAGVQFNYAPDAPALNGVDLVVPAGRTAALVGPSGAGKTTAMNLIPRFYDVTGGRLTIDGQDVSEVTIESLRGAIALVSQDVVLFNDTVRANIAFGRPGASEDEIVDAAKAAAAHEFILGLPDGYDTEVGDRGVKLSGGQQQRVAIARAMLKDAPILLLDEATSALDTESEQQVQEAVERLRQRRTTLVIAHRLSTVIAADVIYVLDQGRVVEAGTHAQLKARSGLYARLVRMQFREQTDGEPSGAESGLPGGRATA